MFWQGLIWGLISWCILLIEQESGVLQFRFVSFDFSWICLSSHMFGVFMTWAKLFWWLPCKLLIQYIYISIFRKFSSVTSNLWDSLIWFVIQTIDLNLFVLISWCVYLIVVNEKCKNVFLWLSRSVSSFCHWCSCFVFSHSKLNLLT